MRYLRLSLDYRLSRLTSPLPLTDITIDWIFHSEPSIATFSLFPSRHKLSVQCIIGPIIQFNDPVKWILAAASDSKSLEKLRVSVESQQSQACAGLCWAAHWCWQILAGNSVLSNSIGLSPGLKLKFLPQKNLQKLLSRAFKDEFLPMVLTKRWHRMYCAWLWISVSSICCQPIPPSTLLNTREPLTHTRHSPKYIEGFFLPSRIWNHQIYLLFLSPSAEFRASQQSRWLELEHRKHQVHTNCRNDHIRAAKSPGVTEMSPGSAPDDIPAPCYQHQPALCSHTSSLNLHWSLSCSQLGQKHERRRKSVKNTT